MKNLTKIVTACLCLGLFFASCNKDNFDFEKAKQEQEERNRKERARRDSILKAQAPELESYAKEVWGERAEYSDSTGIWFKADLAPASEKPYAYKADFTPYGAYLQPWSTTVEFEGKLMDGTVFDKNTEGTPKNYTNINQAIKIYGKAWVQAFIPTIINIRGDDVNFEGLLQKGLQVGDEISFISPSYLTFDQTEYTGSEKVKVQKNTNVIYKIKVIELGDATTSN